jgi:hypothetical protein
MQLTRAFLREQAALLRQQTARGETIAQIPEVFPAVDKIMAAAWVDLCLSVLNLNEFVYLH